MTFLKTGNDFLDEDGGLSSNCFSSIVYRTEEEKRFSLLYIIKPMIEKNEHLVLFLNNETIDFIKQHVPFEKQTFLHFEETGYMSENKFIRKLSTHQLAHNSAFIVCEEIMDFQGRLRKIFNPDNQANYDIFLKSLQMVPMHAFLLHQVNIPPERIIQTPIMADIIKMKLAAISAYVVSIGLEEKKTRYVVKFLKNRYGRTREIARSYQK